MPLYTKFFNNGFFTWLSVFEGETFFVLFGFSALNDISFSSVSINEGLFLVAFVGEVKDCVYFPSLDLTTEVFSFDLVYGDSLSKALASLYYEYGSFIGERYIFMFLFWRVLLELS